MRSQRLPLGPVGIALRSWTERARSAIGLHMRIACKLGCEHQTGGRQGRIDSEFEADVADELRKRGRVCDPPVLGMRVLH